MKKILLMTFAALLLFPINTIDAQKTKKGRNEPSPFIEGKKKVRQTDYDSIWKFTTFDAKSKYFCPFDYTAIFQLKEEDEIDWKAFSPVMNYLTTVSRSPMRMCVVFAINPNIDDDTYREQLIEEARNEALETCNIFKQWCTEEKEMRNKMQFSVAQVDYRYWKGTEFFTTEQPQDPIIHVGYILYFGTKKLDLFPSAASDAKTFKDVKFFPNDATVAPSYYSYLDELANYLKANDRLEVLLCGFSDNTGTSAYNTGLSRQRAVEIKKELVKRGIPDYRIEIEAKGDANPIGDNTTYSGRIANNRVSVTIQ